MHNEIRLTTDYKKKSKNDSNIFIKAESFGIYNLLKNFQRILPPLSRVYSEVFLDSAEDGVAKFLLNFRNK